MKRIIVIAFHNMKRLLFALAIVCLWLPGRAGERFISGGLYYEILSEDDATVALCAPDLNDSEYLAGVSSISLSETVIHPTTEKSYTLVALDHAFQAFNGDDAQYNLDGLESVTVPGSVKTINDFYTLRGLKSVSLPEGLKSLTGFSECHPLKRLELPESLCELGMFSLRSIGIEELVIPDGVKSVPYMCITECKNLAKLSLTNVEWIDDHTLTGLPKLEKLILPPSFTRNYIHSANGQYREIWFESDGVERDWQLHICSFVCKPSAVYCARTTPPVIEPVGGEWNYDDYDEYYMFGGTSNLPNIKLYVPVGCKEAFSQTPYWGLMDIREYDFNAGVETVTSDTLPADGKLYDLQGRLTETTGAAPGIYVRDGRKILVR